MLKVLITEVETGNTIYDTEEMTVDEEVESNE